MAAGTGRGNADRSGLLLPAGLIAGDREGFSLAGAKIVTGEDDVIVRVTTGTAVEEEAVAAATAPALDEGLAAAAELTEMASSGLLSPSAAKAGAAAALDDAVTGGVGCLA